MSRETVAVIGLGYVGLPLALRTEKAGFNVIGVDADNNKINDINNSKADYLNTEEQAQLSRHQFIATNDYAELENADIVIVCVPTPVDRKNKPDLSILKQVCKRISEHLIVGQLIIIESTINPGVCDEIILPIFQKKGYEAGKDFYLAHCPERINPGDETWHIGNIPRVVGANDETSLARAVDFYETVLDSAIKPMGSLKEAEAVKIVENSFRDINIAFVNELAMSFSKLGIDVVNVIDGASTKPFAYMPHFPGAGVGGHCIPVDPYYLIEYAQEKGFTHNFLKTARKVNKGMPKFVIGQMIKAQNLKGILKKKVTLLGLSYKPNVGDLRESPALEMIDLLQKEGYEVTVYDPHIKGLKGKGVKLAANLKDALKGSKVVVLATAHKEFLKLSPSELAQSGTEIVVDGRNCLDKSAFTKSGIQYVGVGR